MIPQLLRSTACRATLALLGTIAARAQTASAPTRPASANQVPSLAESDARLSSAKSGREFEVLRNFVQPYEANELGLTRDKGDELFMDFKLSLMFPLIGSYSDQISPPTQAPLWSFGRFDSHHTAFFFSATVRGGQYLWSRPSAPVVAKRFNPQGILRLWFVGDRDRNRYLDLMYGHESNGQSIDKAARFNEQREIYRLLEDHPDTPDAFARATRNARDAISRGWDYLGTEFSWHALSEVEIERHGRTTKVPFSRTAKIKLRHFLDDGLLQGKKEEYNDWEGDGPRRRRADYDGLMFQYTNVWRFAAEALPAFTGRYTLTYTTGLRQPFRHSTAEVDLGATLFRVPFSVWYRRGYNSDLIDYYKLTQSFGAKISIWDF